MTPTRADLERLIETWRKEAATSAYPNTGPTTVSDVLRRGILASCADDLAALLTSEGPAPTTVTMIPIDADAISGDPFRFLSGPPDIEPAQRPETPTVGTCATCRYWEAAPVYGKGRGGCYYLITDGEDDMTTAAAFSCNRHEPMPLPDAPKEPTPA